MHYDMPLTYFIFEWLGVISSRVERCHPQPAIIAVRFHVRDKCAVPNKTCERKRQAPGGNVIGEPDLTVSDRTEGMTKRINIYTSQRNNVKFSSARNDRQGENYAHTSMLVASRTNGVFWISSFCSTDLQPSIRPTTFLSASMLLFFLLSSSLSILPSSTMSIFLSFSLPHSLPLPTNLADSDWSHGSCGGTHTTHQRYRKLASFYGQRHAFDHAHTYDANMLSIFFSLSFSLSV